MRWDDRLAKSVLAMNITDGIDDIVHLIRNAADAYLVGAKLLAQVQPMSVITPCGSSDHG
jgi:hypothetical protein